MSRQGAGTSVPAPLAYLGGCVGVVCGAAGPGCSVRPWAAARPLAVRAASLRLGASSRSPARPRHRPRAPQPGPPVPPAPYTPAAPAVLCVVVRRLDARPGPAGLASASNRSGLVVSVLSAWPCRRPPAPWLGAMPRGALHTGGAWCADVRLGASARCPARPRLHPPALRPGPLHPAGLASSGHFPHS